MNKARREELLEVAELLEDALQRLEEIRDDEQDAFDALPEGLQASARGESMQDAIDALDDFGDAISSIQSRIEEYAKPPKKK